MRELRVVYETGRDPVAWEREHALGNVPSRWPYGLDHLGNAIPTTAMAARPAGAVRRAVMAMRRDSASAGSAALTWDENAAVHLLPHSGVSRHTGVIWLTDQAAAGRDLRRRLAWLSGFTSAWVLSSAQVAPLERLLGSRAPRVDHVRFGVDHDFFGVQTYPESPLVLSVGGDRDRDTATLYRAMALVREAMPGMKIVVQTSSTLVPPAGVTRVDRLSHTELRELYARASVVTIATRPNLHVSGMTVSLEAASTGRPVVITATAGMSDYVVDGKTGIHVAPGDAEALAAQTADLVRDPDKARELGTAGRGFVSSARTTAHMCEELLHAIAGRRD